MESATTGPRTVPTPSRRSERPTDTPPGRGRRRTVVVVAILSIVIVAAIVPGYLPLDPDNSRVGIRPDVPFHFPVLLVHIFSAAIALLTGPFQFSGTLRRRAPRVHRLLGRTYLIALIPATLSGLVVAVLSTAGPIANVGFVLLDIAWIVTGIQGYRAVRAHRYRSHERWMTRNFAVTFAAVTLRIWLSLLIVAQLPLLKPVYGGDFDGLFQTAYLSSAWLCWVPNVLFIEWYLRRRAGRTSAQSPPVPVGS